MNDRLDSIDWGITSYALADNSEPMAWNLFLAFIPLCLSCVLFNQPRSRILRWGAWILLGLSAINSYRRFAPLVNFWLDRQIVLVGVSAIAVAIGLVFFWRDRQRTRSILWGLGTVIFLLFLPNAAYILTDFIHLILDIRRGYPMGTVMLFLIPQYLFFISIGFEAYVVSIMNLGEFLQEKGKENLIFLLELVLNFLSALGVYLGRFSRFNSWDIFGDLEKLIDTIARTVLSRHALTVIIIMFVIFTLSYRLFKRINLGLVRQKQAFRALE